MAYLALTIKFIYYIYPQFIFQNSINLNKQIKINLIEFNKSNNADNSLCFNYKLNVSSSKNEMKYRSF